MDSLSTLDAYFLQIEDQDPHAALTVGSIAVIDGPAPSQAEIAATVRARLPLATRYRQIVHSVPFALGRPVWVDDPDFDLDFHLRRTALAAPGDEAALTRAIARIMALRLDRDRPLWEYWIVEGLPEGRWALLSKVHHCMVDGIAGVDLYRLMFDAAPDAPAVAAPEPSLPEPPDGTLDRTLDALGDLVRTPFDNLRVAARAALAPAAGTRLRSELDGLAAFAGAFGPFAPSSLTGPLGGARRYAVARTTLAELSATAKAHGVSVNDVYLAAATGAFRRLLLARGETPGPDTVRTLVPVSAPDRERGRGAGNSIAPMVLALPVDEDTPERRLAVVHERIAGIRARHEVQACAAVVSLAGIEPFALVSLAARMTLRVARQALVTVTTNVPGPPRPLFTLGRQIREILPWVPIAERMRLGVALLTYAGQAVIGVTGDFAGAPEVDTFAADLLAELDVLRAGAPHRSTADLL